MEFSLVFWIVLGAVQAAAQVTTAELSGTVTDASQAVLPGATITIINVDTGSTRTMVTDAEGRFRASNLGVGTYEVKADLAGFRTVVRQGIHLTLGRQAVVDVVLHIGQVADHVVVNAEAPLVNTKRAGLSGLMEGETIRELPINGRDFLRLTLLEAGTAQVSNYRKEIGKGLGLQISLNGARPNQTGFLLDGTNIKNTTNFQTPGSAAGVMLGVDAVREFEVLVNGFSAEYGNASGGIVNAITRSGTNAFRGSVFEFHRNDALDAPNFFDVEKPPFTRNQFGFTLGGPVLRDRTFFFGTYEALREQLGLTTLMRVPTAAARSGILPSGPVTVHPITRPFLDLWPLPNGRDFGDGTAEHIFTSQGYPTREDFFVVRMDQRLGGADNLYLRYSFDDASLIAQKGQAANANFGVSSDTRGQFLSAEYSKILGQSTLSMTRFAFNRTLRTGSDYLLRSIDPGLAFVPGTFGSLDVSGLTNPGVDGKFPSETSFDVFELHNQLSLTRGSHAMKVGVLYSRFHNNTFGFTRLGGEYRFNSLSAFLQNRPNRLRLPGVGSDATRHWRQNLFGVFFQDNVALTRRVTLNLGVRYEFVTVPTELDGKVANVRDLANDPTTTVGEPLFRNPSLRNVAPRVGFAWDPRGDGKTSVRGGFGIYYEQLTLASINQIADRNLPFYFDAQVTNPIFPDARLALATQPIRQVLSSPNTIEFNARQPSLRHWNLSLEREVLPKTVMTLAYAASRGVNLPRIVESNNAVPVTLSDGRLFFPDGLARRNPSFGTIDHRMQDGSSSYHSAQLKVARRLSSGVLFNAAYTFAKSIDNSSNGAGPSDYSYPSEVANPYQESAWRGLSEFDVRHNLSVYAMYELPAAKRLSGVFAALLNGWQIGGVVAVRSGSPFPVKMDVDRARSLGKSDTQAPDLAAGANNNPVRPGNPDQYFDPSGFVLPQPGFFGNLGRNTLIGPGSATVDLAFFKNHRFGETTNVQLRVEMFNLFNRANFANPVQNVFVFNEAGPINSAGRITSTATTSRQIQLGLKMLF